ncbi:type II toxin-antitoxin system RelE/ParE family toxin [Acidisoma sp.]|uniref:type II toxin-antitoxin system RelE/ParE family toxin n=1 Tax=Acidisoma sp. TaxID=1872115 RepID=UPI003AFF81A1
MIYAAEARQQIEALRDHYERLDRLEAVIRLQAALAEAEQRIETEPHAGLPAPRPYPELARGERAWIKAGRYWIAYRLTKPPVILGVFYETADLPRRV